MPKTKCTHLHTRPIVHISRCTFRKLAIYNPPARDLWVDDASYAAWQAFDPYADYDPMEHRSVAIIYTGDYCPKYPHTDHCPVPGTWEDVPF